MAGGDDAPDGTRPDGALGVSDAAATTEPELDADGPGFETAHRIAVGDARELPLPDDSVELVVTSPPYPMIELWDDLFADLDPAIGDALDAGEGQRAFERMHAVLDDAWDEVGRVLEPGGIACVNVGDATRTLDRFRVYPNHGRIVRAFVERGFDPLPEILWRKPANSAAKFMGSGMVPPNAYATLEHEYVLVFRNGERRSLEPGADRRYEAAYFWEERNDWFSDLWSDVRGRSQALTDHDTTLADESLRERAAAYPLTIPYRLVNMYSVYGDAVLDPFWGTGTTTIAAMAAGRSSIGVERDPAFADAFCDRVAGVPDLSRELATDRLRTHREFVEECEERADELGYEAEQYGLPVRTRQERSIRFYEVAGVESRPEGYRARHVPVDGSAVPE